MEKKIEKSNKIKESFLSKRKEIIKSYFGVDKNTEHHLENLGTINGVEFINDSQSVDLDKTWYSLEKTEAPIIWIAGGVNKSNDYSVLKGIAKEKIKLIVCLGNDDVNIVNGLHQHVQLIISATNMSDAVKTASKFAAQGDVVLFSPACPSYDNYENYQERGKAFKAEVEKLKWGGL
jgi:UDP-N-acetylmuramoylalanine--D-glutamate ligase